MKTASLTGSLLMMKGRAAPSLANTQTQDYEENKSSMFDSLSTGTGQDEEAEVFVVPDVDEDYLHIPDHVLMSDEELDAPIEGLRPEEVEELLPEAVEELIPEEVEELIPEVAEEADVSEEVEIAASKSGISGPRISTSLRLSEEKHLQLRLLAARQRRSIQAVLQDMVHEHLESDLESLKCICKPEDETAT